MPRNFLLSTLAFALAIGLSVTANAQYSRIGIGLQAGLNRSDMNYGYEFLESLISSSTGNLQLGGDRGRGYSLGLHVDFPVHKSLYGLFSVKFTEARYEIEGELTNFTPNRPPSSEIVIQAEGPLDYRFLELKAGISYFLGQEPKQGLYGSLYLSYLIHSGQKWDLDVIYEDLSEGKTDGADLVDQDILENLWMLGADIGFNIRFGKWMTLGPKFAYQIGLNPVVNGNPAPTISSISLQLSTWF